MTTEETIAALDSGEVRVAENGTRALALLKAQPFDMLISDIKMPDMSGVGEHSAVMRERICGALGWLGLQLDEDANRANATTVSHAGSRVLVAVEPTNEEWVAASHALRVLRGGVAMAARSKQAAA